MVHNRELAARKAESVNTYKAGYCQVFTRSMFDAPSVGDVDRDGDADAVDGWKSEPANAKHTDRNPPRGVPVAFTGGSQGYGHRAVSLGGGRIRSTDMADNGSYRSGVVGTVTIAQIERAMNVKYAGWSETISGHKIPLPVPVKKKVPKKVPKNSRGEKVDQALWNLNQAKGGGKRGRLLKKARQLLRKVGAFK